MKIYWTRKSIPELASLPRAQRNKNYREAFSAISTHIEFWAGLAAYALWGFVFLALFERIFPDECPFPWGEIKIILVVLPGTWIWEQFTINGMRKRYPHILLGQKAEPDGSEVERMIRIADLNEEEQWKNVRRIVLFLLAFLFVLLFVAAM